MRKLIVSALVAIFALASASAQSATVSAVITWKDNSSNETGFSIYRRINVLPPGTNPTKVGAVAAGVVTFTDTAIPAVGGDSVCYTVTADNLNGSSAPSNEICAVVPGLPGVPTLLSVTINVQ